MKVKNYNGLVEELIEMLARLDAEHSNWQTDIYIYIDEQGDWVLDDYMNVGGNSWRNDDHILLYEDRPHYEDVQGWPEDMTTDEIISELMHLYSNEYLEKAWNILDDADIE